MTGRILVADLPLAAKETFVTNCLIGILGLVSGSLAARYLGPTGRGELAAMINWPMFLAGVGSIGLMTASAYYAGREPHSVPEIVATILSALLPLAAIVTIIGYVAMPALLHAQAARTVLGARIVLLVIWIRLLGDAPHSILRAIGHIRAWNVTRLAMPVLWVTVFLVGRLTGWLSPLWAACAFVVVSLLHAILQTLVMVRLVPGVYRINRRRLPALFGYGLPVALTQLPSQANLKLDQLLMATLLPAGDLGLYVAAVAWSGVLAPVMTTVAHLAFPAVISVADVGARSARVARITRLSVLLGAAAGLGLGVLTPVLFTVVFGKAFVAAIPAALVLVGAAVITNVNNVISESVKAMNHPTWPLLAECCGLIVTLALLPLLLVRFGLLGAAITSLISYAITLAALVCVAAPAAGVRFSGFLLPLPDDFRSVVATALRRESTLLLDELK